MNIDEMQLRFISTSDETQRAMLVARQDFPKELYEGVVCDESSKVKLALLEHNDLGAEIITKLCQDKDIEVRMRASDKLCLGEVDGV